MPEITLAFKTEVSGMNKRCFMEKIIIVILLVFTNGLYSNEDTNPLDIKIDEKNLYKVLSLIDFGGI